MKFQVQKIVIATKNIQDFDYYKQITLQKLFECDLLHFKD